MYPISVCVCVHHGSSVSQCVDVISTNMTWEFYHICSCPSNCEISSLLNNLTELICPFSKQSIPCFNRESLRHSIR